MGAVMCTLACAVAQSDSNVGKKPEVYMRARIIIPHMGENAFVSLGRPPSSHNNSHFSDR